MPEIKRFVYPPTGVEHYGKVIDTKDGFEVIECAACLRGDGKWRI